MTDMQHAPESIDINSLARSQYNREKTPPASTPQHPQNTISDQIQRISEQFSHYFTNGRSRLVISNKTTVGNGPFYALGITRTTIELVKKSSQQSSSSVYNVQTGELRVNGQIMPADFLETFLHTFHAIINDVKLKKATIYH